MHKLAFTLIALMLLSPVVNAAVKWNNAGGEDKEPKTSKVQVPVSVFELKRNFSKIYCQMTAAKTDLPEIFETVIEYTGGNEVSSEKAVSNYRKYFMSLSSNARVSANDAKLARNEILRVSKAKKLKWADDWRKNDTNAFFFTASIAVPIAIEVIFQKENFDKVELELIIDYLEFLNKQMRATRLVKDDWETDNKTFDYAVFSYALGLITDEEKHKKRAIKIFKKGIKELRADGSIVADSKRIGSALHYSNKAIAALVTLSELAMIDGISLYDYSHKGFGSSSVKKNINLAITFLVNAGENEKLIHQYAIRGEKRGSTGFKEYSATNQDKRWINNDLIGWGYYYLRRFPEADLSKGLLRLSSYLESGRKGYGETAGANPRCFVTGKPLT